jgi:uncharacterized protein
MPASSHPVSGAPCWVSLMARDLGAAQDFYGRVLGWSFRTTPLGEEFRVATAEDGSPVAGIGALAASLRTAVAWIPYFSVQDADAAAARVRERGATVAVGPLAMALGRAALAADPQGASFGFWAGMTMPGWAVGHGAAPSLLRLRTRDAFAAAIFYAEVLGWAPAAGGGCEVRYERDRVLVAVQGRTVAELHGGAPESRPDPGVRPRWDVRFPVPDVAAAVRAAEEAGGVLVTPPSRDDAREAGSVATLRDPDGGLFAVASP